MTSSEPESTFRANSVDPTGSVTFTDLVIVGSLAETKKAVEKQFAGSELAHAWAGYRWANYPSSWVLYGTRDDMSTRFMLAVVTKA